MEYFGIEYFLTSSSRVYWFYLLSALLISVLFVFLNPKYSYVFSKNIWWHKSAKNDYKYFVVISFLKIVLLLPILSYIVSSKDVSLSVTLLLEESFGYFEKTSYSKELIVVFYTFTLFIVGDFTRYWLHRFLHTVPYLWRLHQVHHSAEVLNPLTFYRVHPLENLLFGLRYALSAGLVSGVFIYFFGASIGIVEIAGANIFVFISGLIGANLRHSHLPLKFGVFEKLLVSPHMHQMHHSTKYTDKNFGGILSIWDYMFNSFATSEKDDVLEFGLKNKKIHNGILEMILEPFYRR
ncbi:sterol desaturase family protein [Sulfurimonas lithotrophica]|uniref:Sterol desaturase family protein n=1 Tax=Sulfurimonas lithotrophica TaxID=2590022 RepID=A0A5P8P2V6_9BACT|nr:sterol desaturase family protein [Sulfurimonas lithotrophica]QFR50004.1 sterol desaturase family protein [Sulfurimonas lithotrophica]